MLLDLINFNKLRRALLYALCLIVALVLQECIFSRISLAGVHVFFVPLVVLAVGFFEGGVWGCVFGLIAGIVTDVCYIETTVLFTVVFAVLGFMGGLLTEYYVNRRFFAFIFASLAALIICAACQAFRPLLSGAGAGAVLAALLKQSVFSLPFAVIVYFPCRAIRRADRKEA